jgi:hypothetical protein
MRDSKQRLKVTAYDKSSGGRDNDDYSDTESSNIVRLIGAWLFRD